MAAERFCICARWRAIFAWSQSDAAKQVLLYKQQMAQLDEKVRLQLQLLEQSQSHESCAVA